MLSDPDIAGPSLPDFVLDKVPMVRLEGERKHSGADGTGVRHTKRHDPASGARGTEEDPTRHQYPGGLELVVGLLTLHGFVE
jgi:hypothetical protein